MHPTANQKIHSGGQGRQVSPQNHRQGASAYKPNPHLNQYTAQHHVVKQGAVSQQVKPTASVQAHGLRQGKHTYMVHLSIFFETIPGQSICVLGSIPELGMWKEQKCHMRWTDGHNWVLEEPLIVSVPWFCYKYMLLDDDKQTMVKWEAGVDRIAELRLLPDIGPSKNAALLTKSAAAEKIASFKIDLHVELHDEWESFLLRFSLFYPMDENSDELMMECDRTGQQMLKLTRSTQPMNWLNVKYGMNMRPWECIIKMPNCVSGDCGQFEEGAMDQNVVYSFQKKAKAVHEIVLEREPKRSIVMNNPSGYNGLFGDKGSDLQGMIDKSYIINSFINKGDGNFLSGFFVSKIANTKIIIGPYPLYQIDVDKIAGQGATAVLNLQTKAEIAHRGIDSTTIEKFYHSKGIKTIVNQAVNDHDTEAELNASILKAVVNLHDLINVKNHTVYVHCTSSVTRAPTVAIAYICLFIKNHQYKQPNLIAQYVKKHHAVSFPNMKAVHAVLKSNTGIQNMEHDKIIQHEIEYLKRERVIVVKYHDQVERDLLARLKALDDAEHQRLKDLEYEEPDKMHIPEPPLDDYGEHFADRSEVDLNHLTEHNQDFLVKCDELFHSDYGAPIPFIPETKGDKSVVELDRAILHKIQTLDVRIPIIRAKTGSNVFLIGTTKTIISIKQDQIIVRVGGGYVQFDQYLPKNHRANEIALLQMMIKSQNSLEWVCDQLIRDQKIPQVLSVYDMKTSNPGQVRDIVITRRRPVDRANLDTVDRSPGYRKMAHNDTSDKFSASQYQQSPNRKSNVSRNSAARSTNVSSPVRRRSTMPATVTKSPVKMQSPIRQRASPAVVTHPSPKKTYAQRKAEYLESAVHQKYLREREQILKDLSKNKAVKEAKLTQIDQEIARIEKHKVILDQYDLIDQRIDDEYAKYMGTHQYPNSQQNPAGAQGANHSVNSDQGFYDIYNGFSGHRAAASPGQKLRTSQNHRF